MQTVVGREVSDLKGPNSQPQGATRKCPNGEWTPLNQGPDITSIPPSLAVTLVCQRSGFSWVCPVEGTDFFRGMYKVSWFPGLLLGPVAFPINGGTTASFIISGNLYSVDKILFLALESELAVGAGVELCFIREEIVRQRFQEESINTECSFRDQGSQSLKVHGLICLQIWYGPTHWWSSLQMGQPILRCVTNSSSFWDFGTLLLVAVSMMLVLPWLHQDVTLAPVGFVVYHVHCCRNSGCCGQWRMKTGENHR